MVASSISRVFCLGIGGSLFVATAASAQLLRFDSIWWQKNSTDGERTGFVLGYFDCPKPAKSVYGASANDYIAYVDINLKQSDNPPVPGLLTEAHLRMKPRAILKGGEEYPEEHSWLDGAWWGDTTHGDSKEKQGYVEGYMACRHQPVDATDVNFFSTTINRYYDLPKHEHTKIAYVLERTLERKRTS